MNLLLIISGESFREGGQYSRLRDTEDSVNLQISCCKSHSDFIDKIQKKYNISVDIQILSYKSLYQNLLLDQYKNYNTTGIFHEEYFPNRTLLTNSIKINNLKERYDSILVIRPDMFLKPFFSEIFNPFSNKICYPSVCFINGNRFKQSPRVNDTIIFIPENYIEKIYYDLGIKLYHEAIHDYLQHGLSHNDFDFFIRTLHDSDSQKDYNPIYRLATRPENKFWHSYGYIITDIDFLPSEVNNQKNIYPDWNLLEDNISEIDRLAIKNYNNLWEWWDIPIEDSKAKHRDPNIKTYPRFINIIEIDESVEHNTIYEVNPKRFHLETYWMLQDNKLSFLDENKNITSIFYKKNNLEFIGKQVHGNNNFILKKINF